MFRPLMIGAGLAALASFAAPAGAATLSDCLELTATEAPCEAITPPCEGPAAAAPCDV